MKTIFRVDLVESCLKWFRGVSVVAALSCSLLLSFKVTAQMTDVLTYHNNNARTGQTLNEGVLTPGNVNSNHFGKSWILPTFGEVLAQPLYAAGVSIPGAGTRNVLFVATETDMVYAFDADSTNVFWAVSVLGTGEMPYQTTFCTITPQIGITATPVIDRQFGPNGTIFIQAMSQDSSSNGHQRLHAIDLATGQDRLTPVEITGSYPGLGDDTDGTNVIFHPTNYVDRACLMLLNGVVYTFWSSHCNSRPSTSWVIGYNEYTLTQASVINLEPNTYFGSMWNADAGPSADTNGNIYVVLGNSSYGDFEGPFVNGFPANGGYGCSLVKLSTTNGSLKVADYFAPDSVIADNENDWDLASGAPVVLPNMTDTNGNTRQLVVAAGKDQNIYIADRTNMGKYNSANNNALYQEMTNIFPGPGGGGPNNYGQSGGIWSMSAYFNGTLYFGPVNGPVTAFPFQNARLSSSSSKSPTVFGFPGATPCVSANGASNGIVWAVETIGKNGFEGPGTHTAVLHAYAASNLANELYNSNQATNGADQFGTVNDFVTPMIASGRVYVPGSAGIGVFGLTDQSTLTPIQQWRNAYFKNPSNVGAGANNATPAGDGVPNLIKYALGLNPFTPATNQLNSASTYTTNGQSYLAVMVNRTASPTDVSLVAQVSSDLTTWVSGPIYTTTLTNTATQLVVGDNQAIGSQAKHYVRLLFVPASNQ